MHIEVKERQGDLFFSGCGRQNKGLMLLIFISFHPCTNNSYISQASHVEEYYALSLVEDR